MDSNGEFSSRAIVSSITIGTTEGVKIVSLKASVGRGRKRDKWVKFIHRELMK